MAHHYMPSYSGTVPFPLTRKPRREAELRALRIRIWLARVLFGLLFAGVLALLAYEIRLVYRGGWRGVLHSPITLQ